MAWINYKCPKCGACLTSKFNPDKDYPEEVKCWACRKMMKRVCK